MYVRKEAGPMIRAARKERKWNQADLAAAVKSNYQEISCIERGQQPRGNMAIRIADALDLDVADLYIDAKQMHSELVEKCGVEVADQILECFRVFVRRTEVE